MKVFVVIAVTVLFSAASAIPMFKTCDNLSNVKTAKVVGCSVAPCVLKRGTNASFEVDFDAEEAATALKAVVHGIIGGVPLPFNPPNVNGCVKSGITCPVVAKKSYKYVNVIPVLSSYPKLRLIVKYELKNESGKNIFCVEVPAQIQ